MDSIVTIHQYFGFPVKQTQVIRDYLNVAQSLGSKNLTLFTPLTALLDHIHIHVWRVTAAIYTQYLYKTLTHNLTDNLTDNLTETTNSFLLQSQVEIEHYSVAYFNHVTTYAAL